MKVLIVDDDALMHDLARFSLPDFEVRDAESGAAALEILRDWRPDLILLDLHMAEMSGAETFARLPRDIPVAVMTAAPAEADPLIAQGAAGVIAKPIDPATFADRVRAVKWS